MQTYQPNIWEEYKYLKVWYETKCYYSDICSDLWYLSEIGYTLYNFCKLFATNLNLGPNDFVCKYSVGKVTQFCNNTEETNTYPWMQRNERMTILNYVEPE